MSNHTIRNGLALAEAINDDRILANEVALNLSDESVRIIVEKATGLDYSTAKPASESMPFKDRLRNLLTSD